MFDRHGRLHERHGVDGALQVGGDAVIPDRT
jgi:hypothetical protein